MQGLNHDYINKLSPFCTSKTITEVLKQNLLTVQYCLEQKAPRGADRPSLESQTFNIDGRSCMILYDYIILIFAVSPPCPTPC